MTWGQPTAASKHAEQWAKLTPAQREAVEKDHDDRMAVRLDELLTGEPSEHFTMHEVSPERRAASLARAAVRPTQPTSRQHRP